MGRDKRAYIAARRQAEFYPPQQAAAAADRALPLPQCTSRKYVVQLVDCSSCIAAATNLKVAAIHEPQSMRWNLVQLIDCGGTAKGIDAPQLEAFYTVPRFVRLIWRLLTWWNAKFWNQKLTGCVYVCVCVCVSNNHPMSCTACQNSVRLGKWMLFYELNFAVKNKHKNSFPGRKHESIKLWISLQTNAHSILFGYTLLGIREQL